MMSLDERRDKLSREIEAAEQIMDQVEDEAGDREFFDDEARRHRAACAKRDRAAMRLEALNKEIAAAEQVERQNAA